MGGTNATTQESHVEFPESKQYKVTVNAGLVWLVTATPMLDSHNGL